MANAEIYSYTYTKATSLEHKDISVTLNTYTSVFDKFKEIEVEKITNYFNATRMIFKFF